MARSGAAQFQELEQWDVGRVTKTYSSGGQRVALRRDGALYFVYTDHLGSTSLLTTEQGTEVPGTRLKYYAYGAPRPRPDAATHNVFALGYTPATYTGQTRDASTGLMYYGARFFDPYLNRWIQPDTIIPDPGNPQDLNRYAYCRNNPLRYVDPSGHDPLDQAWQDEFVQVHHRAPTAEDILIRLFSIAFPGEWNWSAFYNQDGSYIQDSLETVFRFQRPADRSWQDMPGALERLAGWYKDGEEGLFTRDIGSLFGGLANRFEMTNAWPAVSDARNPIRIWVYLNRAGLSSSLMGSADGDANVHHWAWALTMGAEYGPGGSVINTGREAQRFNGDWRNTWSDVSIGNRGAALGAHFRIQGVTDITRAWSFFMLDRWF